MPRRPRIRVQSYGPSDSARELATYLNVKRLKQQTSFRPRPSDIIVNWGMPKVKLNATYLNPLASVSIATCKLKTLLALESASVPTPEFSTTKPTEGKWVARTQLNSHSGQGAVVADAAELPDAPLYTKYIQKDAEYRVIVVGNQAVDVKQKLKRRDFEGERVPYIWSSTNGYIFAREVVIPENLSELGISAIQALGLNYGAVDIIAKNGEFYVLEINSAFGVSGLTIELVGDAIKALINQQ